MKRSNRAENVSIALAVVLLGICALTSHAWHQTESPENSLLSAAQSGNVRELQAALARGAALDAKDKDGLTALMRACKGGHTAVLPALLERGADLDAQSTNGMTALIWATQAERERTLTLSVPSWTTERISIARSMAWVPMP